jgi:tetratricopeptide (TPR) repeat protein
VSTELIKARSKISQVNTYLKKGKLLPSIMSLHEAIGLVARNPLMRSEKEEFSRIIGDALMHLNNDPEFRKNCPITLEYKPGGEKELVTSLASLIEDLQGSAVDEARSMLEAMEKHKREQMERGRSLMEKGKYKEAKSVFDKLVMTYRDDVDIKAQAAELFLNHERYEEALDYLNQALEDFPESVHLYNRIGIVLRKMGKYETAENYYKIALKYGKDDPGLYFNMGRLYIDWKKWKIVEKIALRALQLDPNFDEAQKMLSFARKKMEKAETS